MDLPSADCRAVVVAPSLSADHMATAGVVVPANEDAEASVAGRTRSVGVDSSGVVVAAAAVVADADLVADATATTSLT